MAKKIQLTAEQEREIALIQEETGMTRKAAIRKLQRRARLAAKKTGKAPKAAKLNPADTYRAAGAARAEGLRLFALAGRPKAADFRHVYGKAGIAWTWERRAQAVGLESAEQAAEMFQTMLAKPAKSCLVAPEPKAKGAANGK